MDILTEEQLEILEKHDTLKKILKHFTEQSLEIAQLRRELEELQREGNKKLESIITNKLSEVLRRFNIE